MSILIGEKCRYKLIRGLNCDSTVVLAEDTANRKNVVLREVGGSLKIYKRILAYPHENVEQVQKIIRVKNGYIAVCGFCEGVTLRELMAEDAPLVKIGIEQISEQLCDAACHLYKLGLVHRDITPNNIIVDFGSLDRKLDLKLIDFDISRTGHGGKGRDTALFGTVSRPSSTDLRRRTTEPISTPSGGASEICSRCADIPTSFKICGSALSKNAQCTRQVIVTSPTKL